MSGIDYGQTRETQRRATPEPHRIASTRPTCANGHPWRAETTRWRYRVREARHGSGWERDCLVCKAVSEGIRRKQQKGRYL